MKLVLFLVFIITIFPAYSQDFPAKPVKGDFVLDQDEHSSSQLMDSDSMEERKVDKKMKLRGKSDKKLLKALVKKIGPLEKKVTDMNTQLQALKKRQGYLTFSTEKVSWDVAAARCKSFGARLAVLTNPKGFHAFALNRYQGQGGFWLGATDKSREGTWTWINGEQLGSFPWGPNEPSGGHEDCLEWYHNNNYNDESCSSTRGYVCEHGYN